MVQARWRDSDLEQQFGDMTNSFICRDAAVAPKFSDTLTLFQRGGQILPTIGAVAPKFPPLLRPCIFSEKAAFKIKKKKSCL